MSETQRSWFLNHGVPASRLHVILHGVDTDHFSPSLPLNRTPANPFVALSVGSTGRDFPLLHAVASSFQTRPELRFHILGPKHEASRFATLPNVRFEFNVPDHTLLEAYQNADCLLHLTTSATANNVLVESLSCGTPVIAQSQGGVAEYVNPHCSILVAPTGLQPVVIAMESFLTHPDKHPKMRQAAREHAQSLSWPNIAAQTQALYNTLR
jgi:glycosyltransferase involved in cell wall biosynthesis